MAVEKITMPQLGESVTEGTISNWLVKQGDTVNKYEPLAEVQTDKVNAEIPSSFSGIIKEIIAAEGETLAVGELICFIETEEAETVAEDTQDVEVNKTEVTQKAGDEQPNRNRYSPAVLKLSQEHNINLEQVEGTGKGGRITRKDLLKIIELGGNPNNTKGPTSSNNSGISKQETPKVEARADKKNEQVQTGHGDIEIPVSAIRKTIATNMVRAKHEIPHAWTMVEVDVTNMVAYRDAVKEEFKKNEGYNLTYFAFFVKAVAQALKEFPVINSMWAGDKIIQKREINISIAVATDGALYVPVIKNADEKTIKGIAREINELAQKVRTGKITTADMQGGTFTVNNTGSFGSVQSMGIINYPQAAILQVESIVKRPVIMNGGMFAARDMVNLCMSLDHRVLDGLVCGRFLARIKELLQGITAENTSIY